MIVSCGPVSSLLPVGGTNVAANTQIGRTNTQTVGTTNNTDAGIKTSGNVESITQDFDSGNKVSTEQIDNLTINEVPIWVILLLLLGWLLPTPTQIGEAFVEAFRRWRR